MLISERAAARRLATHGLSLSASQHLLRTGIAGSPQRTTSQHLYDEERVDELVARPHVRADEFAAAFPRGVVIARLPRDRRVDLDSPWEERAKTLSGPWRPRARHGLLIRVTVAHAPGFPIVLSVSGHVVDGAHIVGAPVDPSGTGFLFELEPAGSPITSLVGRRLRGHRGPQVELIGWRAASALREDAVDEL